MYEILGTPVGKLYIVDYKHIHLTNLVFCIETDHRNIVDRKGDKPPKIRFDIFQPKNM